MSIQFLLAILDVRKSWLSIPIIALMAGCSEDPAPIEHGQDAALQAPPSPTSDGKAAEARKTDEMATSDPVGPDAEGFTYVECNATSRSYQNESGKGETLTGETTTRDILRISDNAFDEFDTQSLEWHSGCRSWFVDGQVDCSTTRRLVTIYDKYPPINGMYRTLRIDRVTGEYVSRSSDGNNAGRSEAIGTCTAVQNPLATVQTKF